MCVPVGGLARGTSTLTHVCQPPVGATAASATSAPVGLSSRTCSVPPAAAEATRKRILLVSLKLIRANEIQSPFSMKPMLLPPPASPVASFCTPGSPPAVLPATRPVAVKCSARLRRVCRTTSSWPVSACAAPDPLSV